MRRVDALVFNQKPQLISKEGMYNSGLGSR